MIFAKMLCNKKKFGDRICSWLLGSLSIVPDEREREIPSFDVYIFNSVMRLATNDRLLSSGEPKQFNHHQPKVGTCRAFQRERRPFN